MTKICFCIQRSCTSCYELEISYCPTSITLPVNLTPNDAYYMFVRDKFDNIYRDAVTINAGGDIEMDLTAYPTGFFSSQTGLLEIWLSTNLDGSNAVTLATPTAAIYICLTVAAPVYFVDEPECNLFTDESGNLFIVE